MASIAHDVLNKETLGCGCYQGLCGEEMVSEPLREAMQ